MCNACIDLDHVFHNFRYYHRLLNPKKLIEIGFTRLAPRMTMARTLKLHKLPDAPKTGTPALFFRKVIRLHLRLAFFAPGSAAIHDCSGCALCS
jgi:hypothetical protein